MRCSRPSTALGCELRPSRAIAVWFDAYPGRYILAYTPPRGLGRYLESVWVGDRDITMQEFEVVAGMLPLRVRQRTGGGRMSASAEDGTKAGAVVLGPQEPRLRTAAFIVQSLQSTAGKWKLDNVRPGDYYALRDPGTAANRGLVGPGVHVGAGTVCGIGACGAGRDGARHGERGEAAVTQTETRAPVASRR